MTVSELAGASAQIQTADGQLRIHRLAWLAEQGIGDVHALPHTVKILLENLLRRAGDPRRRRRRRARPRGLAGSGAATSRSCPPAC